MAVNDLLDFVSKRSSKPAHNNASYAEIGKMMSALLVVIVCLSAVQLISSFGLSGSSRTMTRSNIKMEVANDAFTRANRETRRCTAGVYRYSTSLFLPDPNKLLNHHSFTSMSSASIPVSLPFLPLLVVSASYTSWHCNHT
jgi:hypothetical protein